MRERECYTCGKTETEFIPSLGLTSGDSLPYEYAKVIYEYGNYPELIEVGIGCEPVFRSENAIYVYTQVYSGGGGRLLKITKAKPHIVYETTQAEKRNYEVYVHSWTKIKKITAKKKGFTVKWQKDSTQQGYQIQYSLKKSFKGKKTVTIKSYKTTSKTIKKLKGGTKYYVRVRTYKRIGSEKYYGIWSNTKTITTKR